MINTIVIALYELNLSLGLRVLLHFANRARARDGREGFSLASD